jgi:DNA polymerase
MDADEIETGIAAMKLDCEDLLFNNVTDLCSSAVRGCLVAPAGRKLVIADLSNIEGRVLAWLAGEDWKVKAFADFDRGVGHDLYVIAFSEAFDVTPEEVVENKKTGNWSMLQYGKTMELAGGYQGGVGAYRTMGGPSVAALSDDDIQVLVNAWRKSHPNVIKLWHGVERAAKEAIRKPDELSMYDKLQFDMKDGWLRIRLPSGRYLSYPKAEVEEGRITFDGTNQYTRKWERVETYGGKLVENIVQAVARDVFMTGMVGAEKLGYEVCIRVHDELITEVPDTDDYSVEQLAWAMSTNPSWAVGLPLAAAGFETYRYKKD